MGQNTQAWGKWTGQRGPEATASLLKTGQESRDVVIVKRSKPGWLAGGKGPEARKLPAPCCQEEALLGAQPLSGPVSDLEARGRSRGLQA